MSHERVASKLLEQWMISVAMTFALTPISISNSVSLPAVLPFSAISAITCNGSYGITREGNAGLRSCRIVGRVDKFTEENAKYQVENGEKHGKILKNYFGIVRNEKLSKFANFKRK